MKAFPVNAGEAFFYEDIAESRWVMMKVAGK
jgi:hypothetical protein